MPPPRGIALKTVKGDTDCTPMHNGSRAHNVWAPLKSEDDMVTPFRVHTPPDQAAPTCSFHFTTLVDTDGSSNGQCATREAVLQMVLVITTNVARNIITHPRALQKSSSWSQGLENLWRTWCPAPAALFSRLTVMHL